VLSIEAVKLSLSLVDEKSANAIDVLIRIPLVLAHTGNGDSKEIDTCFLSSILYTLLLNAYDYEEFPT
jgi:hypothetical protein